MSGIVETGLRASLRVVADLDDQRDAREQRRIGERQPGQRLHRMRGDRGGGGLDGAWWSATVVVVSATVVVVGVVAVVAVAVVDVDELFAEALLHALSSAAPPARANSRRRDTTVCRWVSR